VRTPFAALKRELADYGWERRVSVAALVEQALQKGCHFPLSHLSPTDRLAGFATVGKPTPSVGTDRHDALERHLLRNEQTKESLLNRLPNEVRQTTRNATRLDPADLPCVIGRPQILSHFLHILN